MEMDFAGMGLEKEPLPELSIPGAIGKTPEHPINQRGKPTLTPPALSC